jgi:CheY-like chemotaxis protein
MQIHPHPARILVIEDNPHDIRMLRYALDQHGHPYDLQVLSDGEQALEFVKHQRQGSLERPCVIVLDLHLPKHRGIDVLRAIHEVPALSHVSVAVLTSCGYPSEEQQALELGARIYRTKPFELDDWANIAGEILALCAGTKAEHV